LPLQRATIKKTVAAAVIALAATANLNAQFASGTGSSGDPYIIQTPAQLAKLAELVIFS